MTDKRSSNVIRKLDAPILTARDVPYEASLIFNAGVIKHDGKYIMVFRNDVFDKETRKFKWTNLGLAYSDDGVNWKAEPKPWFEWSDSEIERVYDPRLMEIDGEIFITLAVDTKHGLRGAVAKITSFDCPPQIISMSVPDNRNMVLFPEKIGGNFVRLERPMPVYSFGRDKFDIWLSESPDLVYWGKSRLVIGTESVTFSNDKIGPAAPPIKTELGWLTVFHSVEIDKTRGKNGWENSWQKMYYGGIALLDLNDPSKVLGIHNEPLIACDRDYEEEDGFRKDVIFPTGVILEDNGEVKIYYGASDTVMCLASASVDDLINLCLNNRDGKNNASK